ncbi:hypothetical protein [Bordetella bronchiseptica]|uniref:hypothetical protein n=1 Tax=Bordetella bronchiseptica TaxID=518 RepID=UPI00049F3236|nr:hypothetical protein [Bordetella bronchiseptica]KDB58482.1 hypothetical protein AZ15_1969 [Bordetella bronchiseptica A1-7]KDB69750.1 hypothetical protein AZ21_3795 [Bordetella bronchiseptica B20-10725633]KDB70751.1 hypothetical protein AZ21_1761 [Bordetella bronchiseptica B20-10725633]KDB73039.1 hypothetical protein AZ21_2219 [Bordetella bronchiseptica B20-10725633]
MRKYDFDEDSARQAGASSFIDATGKYKGTFTMAKQVISQKGTEGVEFSFEADDGRTANYLQLWTFDVNGKPLYGKKVLDALMCCARVKTLTSKEGTVEGKDGPEKAVIFPGLHGRSIGLLLQREEYQKSNGTLGYKFSIYAPFHAETELMAVELLDGKTTPEMLPKVLDGLQDKPLQSRPRTPSTNHHAQSENPADPWGD